MKKRVFILAFSSLVFAFFATESAARTKACSGQSQADKKSHKDKRSSDYDCSGPVETDLTIVDGFTVKRDQDLALLCAAGVSNQEDLDASLEYCNAALEENPEDADTYYYRGYNYYYLEDYPTAEADFTKAIEYNTRHLAQAYFARGAVKEHLRKLHEAAQDFKKALELSPDWSQAKRKVEEYAWAYKDE